MTDISNTLANTALLSDKTYNILKRFVQIVIPYFASMYFTIDTYWRLPNVKLVLAIAAIVAFSFGIVLQISQKSYEASRSNVDGNIVITKNSDGLKLYSLELNIDPEEIDNKDTVIFRVGV